MITFAASRLERHVAPSCNQRAMVDFLRARVLEQSGRLERFHALFLDAHHTFLGDAPLGKGCTRSLSVRMRDVFGTALNMNAHAIVVAHNHPSGRCRPSQFDIDATKRLKDVANALDFHLLDHLIFTHDTVYSMRAGGDL